MSDLAGVGPLSKDVFQHIHSSSNCHHRHSHQEGYPFKGLSAQDTGSNQQVLRNARIGHLFALSNTEQQVEQMLRKDEVDRICQKLSLVLLLRIPSQAQEGPTDDSLQRVLAACVNMFGIAPYITNSQY